MSRPSWLRGRVDAGIDGLVERLTLVAAATGLRVAADIPVGVWVLAGGTFATVAMKIGMNRLPVMLFAQRGSHPVGADG